MARPERMTLGWLACLAIAALVLTATTASAQEPADQDLPVGAEDSEAPAERGAENQPTANVAVSMRGPSISCFLSPFLPVQPDRSPSQSRATIPIFE